LKGRLPSFPWSFAGREDWSSRVKAAIGTGEAAKEATYFELAADAPPASPPPLPPRGENSFEAADEKKFDTAFHGEVERERGVGLGVEGVEPNPALLSLPPPPYSSTGAPGNPP